MISDAIFRPYFFLFFVLIQLITLHRYHFYGSMTLSFQDRKRGGRGRIRPLIQFSEPGPTKAKPVFRASLKTVL